MDDDLAAVIKIVWHLWRERHTDEWNGRENPETDSHSHGCLISDKGAKAIC